MESPWTTEHSP